MPYAISIKSQNKTAKAISGFWTRFGALEAEGSMAALNYPPHITLARYDAIDEGLLSETMQSSFEKIDPFTLRFEALNYFEEPSLVIWAAPVFSTELKNTQAEINRRIDPALCAPRGADIEILQRPSLDDLDVNAVEAAMRLR